MGHLAWEGLTGEKGIPPSKGQVEMKESLMITKEERLESYEEN